MYLANANGYRREGQGDIEDDEDQMPHQDWSLPKEVPLVSFRRVAEDLVAKQRSSQIPLSTSQNYLGCSQWIVVHWGPPDDLETSNAGSNMKFHQQQ